MPKISDPRLNTAQIVVKGHEGDKDQPIDYPKGYIDRAKWWMILASSILVALCGSWYSINYISHNGKAIKITVLCFSSVCFIIFLTIFILSCSKVSDEMPDLAHPRFLSAHIACTIVFAIIGIICNAYIYYDKYYGKDQPKVIESKCCCVISMLSRSSLFLSWYFISQHSMWVLCGGISSEPRWAIPLFLSQCFFYFILFCPIYLYHFKMQATIKLTPKSRTSSDKIDKKDKLMAFCHLFLGFGAMLAIIVTVMLSFVYHVGLPTENILEVIIAGALLWLVKNSGF